MGRDDKLFGYYKRGLSGLKNIGKHRSSQENVANKRKKINK